MDHDSALTVTMPVTMVNGKHFHDLFVSSESLYLDDSSIHFSNSPAETNILNEPYIMELFGVQ